MTRLVAIPAALDYAREFDSRAWKAAFDELAAVENTLTAAEAMREALRWHWDDENEMEPFEEAFWAALAVVRSLTKGTDG